MNFNVGGPGTVTLSTTNSAGCDDYEITVNVTAIESADLKIVTAGM